MKLNENTNQSISKKDFQTLIKESRSQRILDLFYKTLQLFLTPVIIAGVSYFATVNINKQQRENTKKLTEQQIESAKIIADANREHSAKIAKSEQKIKRLDHIKEIFSKIITEEKDGLNNSIGDDELEMKKMQLASLEVYKEDSLLFLLNIKEHYKHMRDQKKANDLNTKRKYEELIVQTESSIQKILLNSQVDVSNRVFIAYSGMDGSQSNTSSREASYRFEDKLSSGASPYKIEFVEYLRSLQTGSTNNGITYKTNVVEDFERLEKSLEQINLRQQKYNNYNFTGCTFVMTNLYRSDFSSCTLKDNLFIYADLQEAKFSESNLSGSIFYGSNIQKANFRDSRLRDVIIINPIRNERDANEAIKSFCRKFKCCEMEGAHFTLGSLLKTSYPPFNVFNVNFNKGFVDELQKELRDLYLNLLIPHVISLKSLAIANNSGELDESTNKDIANLLSNTGTENIEELLDLLMIEAKKYDYFRAASFNSEETSILAKK